MFTRFPKPYASLSVHKEIGTSSLTSSTTSKMAEIILSPYSALITYSPRAGLTVVMKNVVENFPSIG